MISRVAPVAGRVVLLLAVLYGFLVGLGLLLTRVLDDSGLVREEDQLNQALEDGRTPTMNDVTYVLSGLGNTGAIIAALVVVAVGLRIASKRWSMSIFLVLAVSAQALVFLLVTLVISRQRPDVKRLDASPPTSSFPSGHTGAATALFLGSALLIAWYVKRRAAKILAITLLVAVPLLVAYGRLYRGMHHPTDIVAAWLNGIVCIAIASTNVLRRPWRSDRSPDPQQAPVTAGVR